MQVNSWHYKLFRFHLSFWIWKVWKGRKKSQKSGYLENENSFLDEIKNIFQFLMGYHLVKKKMIKTADASFNIKINSNNDNICNALKILLKSLETFSAFLLSVAKWFWKKWTLVLFFSEFFESKKIKIVLNPTTQALLYFPEGKYIFQFNDNETIITFMSVDTDLVPLVLTSNISPYG